MENATVDIWADLDKVTLRSGCGTGKEGDCCVIQEVRRRIGLDPSVDHRPPTMCPVVHTLMIKANDSYTTPPSELMLLAPKALNTLGDTKTTVRRAMRVATEALRLLAPMFDAMGKKEHADKFRDYPEIMDRDGALEAKKTAYAAYAAAYAAANAANAAYAAADAAYAANAAYAAANAAAAAYAAADAAANAAAYAAANAAAYAANAADAAYAAANAAAKKAKGEFCMRMINEFCAEEIAA